jgi:hypothetical protein
MSDWSSFKKDKIVTDAWRSFLNEGTSIEVDEGIADSMKRLVGGTKKALKGKKGEEGEIQGTVYRNIIAEVTVLVANIIDRLKLRNKISAEAIVGEFEKMITAQRFELAEEIEGGRAFTGEGTPLHFLPEGHPELTKFVAAVKQSKYLKNFAQALARAGFEAESIESVLGGAKSPEESPEAAEEQLADGSRKEGMEAAQPPQPPSGKTPAQITLWVSSYLFAALRKTFNLTPQQLKKIKAELEAQGATERAVVVEGDPGTLSFATQTRKPGDTAPNTVGREHPDSKPTAQYTLDGNKLLAKIVGLLQPPDPAKAKDITQFMKTALESTGLFTFGQQVPDEEDAAEDETEVGAAETETPDSEEKDPWVERGYKAAEGSSPGELKDLETKLQDNWGVKLPEEGTTIDGETPTTDAAMLVPPTATDEQRQNLKSYIDGFKKKQAEGTGEEAPEVSPEETEADAGETEAGAEEETEEPTPPTPPAGGYDWDKLGGLLAGEIKDESLRTALIQAVKDQVESPAEEEEAAVTAEHKRLSESYGWNYNWLMERDTSDAFEIALDKLNIPNQKHENVMAILNNFFSDRGLSFVNVSGGAPTTGEEAPAVSPAETKKAAAEIKNSADALKDKSEDIAAKVKESNNLDDLVGKLDPDEAKALPLTNVTSEKKEEVHTALKQAVEDDPGIFATVGEFLNDLLTRDERDEDNTGVRDFVEKSIQTGHGVPILGAALTAARAPVVFTTEFAKKYQNGKSLLASLGAALRETSVNAAVGLSSLPGEAFSKESDEAVKKLYAAKKPKEFFEALKGLSAAKINLVLSFVAFFKNPVIEKLCSLNAAKKIAQKGVGATAKQVTKVVTEQETEEELLNEGGPLAAAAAALAPLVCGMNFVAEFLPKSIGDTAKIEEYSKVFKKYAAHPYFLEASQKEMSPEKVQQWIKHLKKHKDAGNGAFKHDGNVKYIPAKKATDEQKENLNARYYGFVAQELYGKAKKGIDKAISSIGKEVGDALDASPDINMTGSLTESLLSESEIKRWQTIAGIKKSVI